MFGIGPFELILIVIVVIVMYGPKQLPSVMKQAARLMVQARRYSNDMRNQFQDVMQQVEKEVALEELEKLRKELRDVTPKLDGSSPDQIASSAHPEPNAHAPLEVHPQHPEGVAGTEAYVSPQHGQAVHQDSEPGHGHDRFQSDHISPVVPEEGNANANDKAIADKATSLEVKATRDSQKLL